MGENISTFPGTLRTVFRTDPDAYKFDRRLVPATERKSFCAKTISARQRMIIEQHLLGATNVDIAERLDITIETVSRVLCTPMVQAYLGQQGENGLERTLAARQEIIEGSEDAISLLRKAVTDGRLTQFILDEETGEEKEVQQLVGAQHRLSAAMDLASRNPASARVTHQVSHSDVGPLRAVLEAAKARADAAGSTGFCDVTPIEASDMPGSTPDPENSPL